MLRLFLLLALTAALAASLTITGTISCKDSPVVGSKLFLRTMSGKARSEIKVDAKTDEEGKFSVEVPEADLARFNAPKTTRHLDFVNSCAKSIIKANKECFFTSTRAVPESSQDTVDLGAIAAFMEIPSMSCPKKA